MSVASFAVEPLQAVDKAVIVGVNVVGVQQMSEQQQDALIAQLRQNGVKPEALRNDHWRRSAFRLFRIARRSGRGLPLWSFISSTVSPTRT